MRINFIKNIFILIFLFSGTGFSQIKLIMPAVTDTVGKELLVPISLSNITGKKISSYQLQFGFEPSKLNILATSVAGTLSEKSTTTNFIDSKNGIVRIAWAISDTINGEGNLLNLKIKLLKPGETEIKFESTGTYPNGGTFTSMIGAGTTKIEAVQGKIVCLPKKKKT